MSQNPQDPWEEPEHEWVQQRHHPHGPVPVNRAQGCFRVLLWLVPTMFLPFSLVLAGFGFKSPIPIILVNVLFTLGTGWFSANFSRRVLTAEPQKRNERMVSHVGLFFLAQLLIVPLVWVSIIYAVCSANPLHL